jgi:hypothetical protein
MNKTIKPPTESQIQQQCVEWFKMQYPKLKIAASMNGGYLAGGYRSFARHKAEGALVGDPDLRIMANNGKTLYIEMKTPRGVISSEQSKLHKELLDMGHTVYVARSFDEFKNLVDSWMVLNFDKQ